MHIPRAEVSGKLPPVPTGKIGQWARANVVAKGEITPAAENRNPMFWSSTPYHSHYGHRVSPACFQ
jgi:hypothetical protein